MRKWEWDSEQRWDADCGTRYTMVNTPCELASTEWRCREPEWLCSARE